jgi:hypothetical protein
MNEAANGGKKNGLLQTIFASGDTTIKVLTMALVVVSGGTNLFATKSLSTQEKDNVRRALLKIYDLNEKLDDITRRQKDIENIVENIDRKTK